MHNPGKISYSLVFGFILLMPMPLAHAQLLSGVSNKSAEELSAEGRLVVGRGVDYVFSSLAEPELSQRLRNSMLERRKFAWQFVEQMIQPEIVALADGTQVAVPRWQTWYESEGSDLKAPFERFFQRLKANPNVDLAVAARESLDDQPGQPKKNLARTLTDQNFTAILRQFRNVPNMPAEFGSRGFTLFSPAFITHVMINARTIDECKRNSPADRAPPSPDNFSPCMKEFPRAAVMVKTAWDNLDEKVPRFNTAAQDITAAINSGTWPAGTPTDVTEQKIYTNISREGNKFGLKAIHFSTKDVREWVWVTLWWDPDASKDFGADRPTTIARYNNGVWANYKMCVVSAFEEGDATPGWHYTGTQSSLGEVLTATDAAIRQQIRNGTSVLDDFTDFQPGSLGPWQAPFDKVTTWCSNPNLEFHPGNARTSCIGCHQHSYTTNEPRRVPMEFWHITAGDVPQFGRLKLRNNFPSEFAWSFDFEFQPLIKVSRAKAQFNW